MVWAETPVRLDLGESYVTDRGQGIEVQLRRNRATAYGLRLRDNPMRLIVDLAGVEAQNLPNGFDRADRAQAVTLGPAPRAGWGRLSLNLTAPMVIERAVMDTRHFDAVRLTLRLRPATAQEFATHLTPASADEPPQAVIAEPAPPLRTRPLIALDPGHGGIDPGAERDGYSEADLVLLFALELREMLLRDGLVDVFMTRERDEFIPLPYRMSRARIAGADLFISIHADALAAGDGMASGATVYTLSETGSDAASAALAAQHDRADLLAGVDLGQSDDVVADLLMDLARLETDPRSDALADALVTGLEGAGVELHSRPRLEANFTVLRAPDYPSVLLEIGFMSEGGDLENILDPVWRSRAQGGIARAIEAWLAEDNLRRSLMRR
ncbi:N-acetylmuramoyl-L-alanine amidase [Rhodobacterales bacterium HKCCA1065]|nr:N-acetylmuramoyl-L-alanine amidase [Rhodobacterales bacterium HKCCA1065]